MKTIGLYLKPSGTVVTLHCTPSDPVVTYVVFVQKWTAAGAVPVATWHPADLESTEGASVKLQAVKGYDIILKAQISADATMTAALDFDGAAAFNGTVALPQAEGPVVAREWSIVIA